MCRLVTALLGTVFFTIASAQEGSEQRPLVDQRDYADSINGCGPAAILNLLRFSRGEFREVEDELLGADDAVKMRFIVDRYFKGRRSSVFEGARRWAANGVEPADFALGLNELLEENRVEPLNAVPLDREAGESTANHLMRCRELIGESLGNEVLPILNLKSYVVRTREGEPPKWSPAFSHFVVVRSMAPAQSSIGMDLRVIDPWRGREIEMTIHRESLRVVNDGGSDWMSRALLLQVLAPQLETLRPKRLVWSERFVITASFLIGDF